MPKEKLSKKDIAVYVMMAVTGISITVAGIVFDQSFLRILPLYVSLVISTLQTKVNRFALLLGGVNSILYGVVYIYYKLYGAAFSALLFSCPIQLITFIRWNKNKRGNSTELRRMTNKQRILLFAGIAVLTVGMVVVLPLLGSEYVLLDSITTLLGIAIYFLTMFAFVEYTTLMIINCTLGTVLYITMLKDSPDTSTYLIYSVYSLICVVFAFFEARKLYAQQQKENAEKSIE
ncbi:MAG: nicotinamide mononucleotide transporter [Clostridia bacterium]|nr:nicotinamide mononucleotide transporter [Clostridia bacterium]